MRSLLFLRPWGDANHVVAVAQVEVDGRQVDTIDRIKFGADLIRQLVAGPLN